MHTNLLIHSSSPYLKQHAHNPVEWREWGIEALDDAQKQNKPLIVSIGYSACHWCHVMERECFENESLAQMMNQNFVCIKVDREERPDIDQVYMDAIQNMGLRGGWPLNVFCMPDGSPFYGGTYFPPQNWQNILLQVSNAYQNHFEEIQQSAFGFKKGLNTSEFSKYGLQIDKPIEMHHLDTAFGSLQSNFDTEEGGMNRAPKFPMPCGLSFLLNYSYFTSNIAATKQLDLTLTKMALGGIYDQLAGGFARYSTDALWFAPHFEKMMYDNAQLVSLYALAYQKNQNPLYKKVVFETIEFVKNELSAPLGGFYSALDADSEGEEGKFYVWKYAELEAILGNNLELFCITFNITKEGNWEHGNNILFLSQHIDNEDIRLCILKLLVYRNNRIRPGLDYKIITSWHAMMVCALVDAHNVFGEPSFLENAILQAQFITNKLTFKTSVGLGLYRLYTEKDNEIIGFLEDYAFVIRAFINLYQTTFDIDWLLKAKQYTDYVLVSFEDKNEPFLYFTDIEGSTLIARKKEIFDNVIPSSNAVMGQNLFILGHFFSNDDYIEKSSKMLKAMQKLVLTDLNYTSEWANLALLHSNPFYVIVYGGGDSDSFAKEMAQKYLPNKVLACVDSKKTLAIFENKSIGNIYICENNACQAPVKSVKQVFENIFK